MQIVLQESGEHVLITAGEVHLQRCLQDLRENYAKIEIIASQPIVPFRETIVAPLDLLDNGDARLVNITTPDKRFSMQLQAVSLPEEVTAILESSVDIIRTMCLPQYVIGSSESSVSISDIDEEIVDSKMRNKFSKLRDRLDQAFRNADWGDSVDRILSFGPRSCGPNVLFNRSLLALPNVWDTCVKNSSTGSSTFKCLSSVNNGFQLASLAGPLCEEPLHGVAFIVEDICYVELELASITLTEKDDIEDRSLLQQHMGSFSGQIMSAVKDGCRRAFQNRQQRLMAAMYKCSIQVSGEVVGKCFSNELCTTDQG